MITSGERRIYPPKDLEDFLTQLVSELRIFETKQKALMFAAALGSYRTAKSTELKPRGEGIRLDIFQRAVDDPFIDALAVAVTQDLQVLSPDRTDDRLRIFEENALAGLIEMKKLAERPTDTIEEFIALTQNARQAVPDDLPGIDPEALAALEGF